MNKKQQIEGEEVKKGWEKVKNIKVLDFNIEKWLYGNFTTKDNPEPLDPIDGNDPRKYRWRVAPYEVGLKLQELFKSELQRQKKELVEKIEIWFEVHDKLNKNFQSNDLIKYLEELEEKEE